MFTDQSTRTQTTPNTQITSPYSLSYTLHSHSHYTHHQYAQHIFAPFNQPAFLIPIITIKCIHTTLPQINTHSHSPQTTDSQSSTTSSQYNTTTPLNHPHHVTSHTIPPIHINTLTISDKIPSSPCNQLYISNSKTSIHKHIQLTTL